jgi:murein DD-endopeptidase MepM/ murein hydrolase activator NlpD
MREDNNNVVWKSPLPDCSWSLPCGKYHPAAFGARRKYNIHTGVDLFCEHMQPLASVEDGIVVAIKNFSKNKNKSPWLNKTKAILIEGESGVVAYCNVSERPGLQVGDLVDAGEIIGNVIRINKKKRRKDICMLHLELYEKGTTKRVTWSCNYPKPKHLKDPSPHLIKILTQTLCLRKRSPFRKQNEE